MAKFRTKPVEVDALFYTYPASDEMLEFCGNTYYSEDAGDATHAPEMGLMIDNACHIANEGDWVVKNSDGVLGVFSNAEFSAEYEPVICRLCDNTGMFYGDVGPCNCEVGVRLQKEKQDTRSNCTAITFTAKSKTEDLRDILPRTFNNQSEDE